MDLPFRVEDPLPEAISEPALRKIVDALIQPAFVICCKEGSLRHANTAARRIFRSTPRWLPACACRQPGTPAPWQKVVHIDTEKGPRDLVFPALHAVGPEDAPHSVWAQRWELPPRLARVAACLMRGDSDKEIATQLGLGFHTVRTYTKSLYRKVGVHSRGELVQKILEACGLGARAD